MKSLFKLIALIFLGQSLCATATIEEVVKDTFYVGKTSSKPDLTFVMERVSDENIKDWQHYATEQSNNQSFKIAAEYDRSFNGDGSGHFKKVLSETSYRDNEIWIAYITTQQNPNYTSKKFYNYESECSFITHIKRKVDPSRRIPDYCTQGQNILMFVTITSSPSALITSHMGISKTAEAIINGNEHKGISMDIHSFGAQVMLLRNPNRRFMVNAPVAVMEKIIEKNLPKNAVFIGERSETEKMFSLKDATLETLLNSPEKEKFEEDLKILEKRKNKKLKSFNASLQDESTQKVLEEFQQDEVAQSFLRYNEENRLFEVDPTNYEIEKNKVQEDSAETVKIPSGWQLFISKALDTFDFNKPIPESSKKKLYSLLEMHPSLIKVEENGNAFTLYKPEDRTQEWLHIEKGNKDYQWLFTEPFRPAGSTHYVVIDLQALADFSFKQ